MDERLIVVDAEDNVIGFEEKLAVHHKGLLHRAFSAFVFNSGGDMLLQKRASGKYHSAGLWSNACCGHPRPAEATDAGMSRRLDEEMGLTCPLGYVTPFLYREEVSNGLIEHEYDHIFVGVSDRDPAANADEVDAWCWVDRARLDKRMAAAPAEFTIWFRHIVAAFGSREIYAWPESVRRDNPP